MQKRVVVMSASILFLITLATVSIVNFFKTSDQVTGLVIARDIEKLTEIFQKIHATCHIIGFDYQKNPINFLNVKEFTSSEVGPMNLAYPKKWKGPYLDDNLAVQGKEYMVVKTNQGYFITPGEGVLLPNNNVIGKDIILDENANISAMLQDKNGLSYQGKPLAASMNYLHDAVDLAVMELSE